MLLFSSVRLDRDTGELYTRGKMAAGEHDFAVRVYDKLHDKQVVSTVSVHVTEIGDDAVYSSGSLRLKGQ